MKNEDIFMTLFENLPTLFKYLIIVSETMLMRELTMNYMTTCFMHEIWNRKEKKSQSEDAPIMFQQNKGDNSFPCQGAKSCFYYDKLCFIIRFCYKTKNK